MIDANEILPLMDSIDNYLNTLLSLMRGESIGAILVFFAVNGLKIEYRISFGLVCVLYVYQNLTSL